MPSAHQVDKALTLERALRLQVSYSSFARLCLRRTTVVADKPGAAGPSRAFSASEKSPVEMPFRYSQGDQFFDAFGAPQVRRQNLGGKSKLVTLLIHAAVVDSMERVPSTCRHRMTRSSFVGLSRCATTKRRPCSSISSWCAIDVPRRAVGLDGLQQHAPRTVPQHLVQLAALADRGHLWAHLTLIGNRFKLSHGVSFLFARPGSGQTLNSTR